MTPFLWASAVFLFAGLAILASWGYTDSFLRLNALHTPWLDALMPHYTHLGDGAMMTAVLALILIRRDKALVLTMASGMLMVFFVVSLLKRLVFPDWFRPPALFEAGLDFHFVSLTTERMFTFPSGHSTAAAAVFTFLGFFLSARNRYLGILAALLAVTAGYSRTYIGVHFLGDVVAGNLLGVVIAMTALLGIYPHMQHRLHDMSASTSRRLDLWLYALAGILMMGSLWQFYFPLYL